MATTKGFASCPAALTRPGTAMHWIAPSEKDLATDTLEKRLWAAADPFRANSGLIGAKGNDAMRAIEKHNPQLAGIRQSELRNIAIVVPPPSTQKREEPNRLRLAEQKSTLAPQIQNLHRRRDLLLPRLLSGQVELSTIDALPVASEQMTTSCST